MSYDPNVLRRATDRLEEQRRARTLQAEQRRQQAYARQPRLAQIDRELRGTMARLVTTALRRGEDPAPALEKILPQQAGLLHNPVGHMGQAVMKLQRRPGVPGSDGQKDLQTVSLLLCPGAHGGIL